MKDTVFLKCDGFCKQYMRVNSLKVVKDKLEDQFSCYVCGDKDVHQVKKDIGITKNYWILDNEEEQINLIKDYEFKKIKCPNCSTVSDNKEMKDTISCGACQFYKLHGETYVKVEYTCLHCMVLMDLLFKCDHDSHKGKFDSDKTKKYLKYGDLNKI